VKSGVNRLYEVDVYHRRQTPLVHEVRQRGYMAYVDLADLPHVFFLARFDSADHIGDPTRSIRANVDAFLAEHGVDLDGGQVTMLTQPRSLGYVFNPLTLFWCHDPSGALIAVIAEVHNTYGERHAYFIRPDSHGRAQTPKEFYVSPFYPVDGHYQMSLPEPGDQLAVTITLHRPDSRPFVASVRGTARPMSTRSLVRLAIRHPLTTYAARAGITWHGLRLYRKGLPVAPRPGAARKGSSASTIARLYEQFVGAPLPIRLQSWDGSTAGPDAGPTLVLNSPQALRQIIAAPSELGLARAYVSGDLDVDGDVTEGLRQVWAADRGTRRPGSRLLGGRDRLRAMAAAAKLGVIGRRVPPPAIEAQVRGLVHSRDRDRAVIAHHYDLSNTFYGLVLDDTMAYSAAYFTHDGQSLAEAQRAKLDLICRKLDLQPDQRLLDVGCGWGSLILHAAEHFGARTTGLTLSAQQHEYVSKLVAERGLADQVTVLLGDYRDLELPEPFDAVTSIEMGEHVGQHNYPSYTATLYRAAKPGGRLLLQQMSRHADTAPAGGAFIETYVAPDMHMRPLPETLSFLEARGFEIVGVENLRRQYVLTAQAWLANLEANHAALVDVAGEQMVRAWRLYLAGGGISFEAGRMGVDQIIATRS
jgi:cyclopropane fatty-acyl-phospholipid synthase-like methyltransferase/DUF1365 family protein